MHVLFALNRGFILGVDFLGDGWWVVLHLGILSVALLSDEAMEEVLQDGE